MKHLQALNKYFWRYRLRLFAGIFFVITSNYFAVLAPEITGFIVGEVQRYLSGNSNTPENIDMYTTPLQMLFRWLNHLDFYNLVLWCSIIILILALLRGVLMFFMRQTIIVMSRHIEYDLKNDIYAHYQTLDSSFYKMNSTGDLMSRITEDVSRVRMYAGPAIMYLTNLIALISFCIINMLKKDVYLTLIVISPLPVLACLIYYVNTLIHKKSEKVQRLLSLLTTNAQEAFSGIKVIKSFVQEKAMLGFFKANSEAYKKNAVSLARVDSLYFPGITLLIGLSTLLTIFIGSKMALQDPAKVGTIVEFVIYINMLTFPVSSIGWVASMVQRASASQKRLNEFLETETLIKDEEITLEEKEILPSGDIVFDKVTFTYPHTGIKALYNFSLEIKEGHKVLLLGKTGSGKSTVAQLLLRFYNPDSGLISIGNQALHSIPLVKLRDNISYIPQDVFLFSDTIQNNISFGIKNSVQEIAIQNAATNASIHQEIEELPQGYNTRVGERGITLSGGQKQRVSIARALLKDASIMVFDDCLSAVDAKTENQIVQTLNNQLKGSTTIIITHRIITAIQFDTIIVIDNGVIIEKGTHSELLNKKGYYNQLFELQGKKSRSGS